jgi:hypothetical protein
MLFVHKTWDPPNIYTDKLCSKDIFGCCKNAKSLIIL